MPDSSFIPALPGTFLVFAEPGKYHHPIVGWHVTPAQAFPITPFARTSVLAGEGVMLLGEGTELVFDLVWKKVFVGLQAWRDAVVVERPYEIGTVPGAAMGSRSPTARSEAPEPRSGQPVPGVVQFTGKLYERKSFWKIGDGLVVLEPGEPTPVGPGVEKITRDAFDQAKRGGAPILDRDPAPQLPQTDPVSSEERDPPPEEDGTIFASQPQEGDEPEDDDPEADDLI